MNTTLKVLAVAASALLLTACAVPEDETRDALDAYGFKDASLGDIAIFGCDVKSDGWSRKFTATGPTGVRVNGVVCKGLFKGATVRIMGKFRG